MSFFDFLKRNQLLPTQRRQLSYRKSKQSLGKILLIPTFFQGYDAAITDLENNGKVAAAETLRANQSKLQLAFLTRFEKQLQNDLQHIADSEMKTDHIIASVNAVRVYNKQMNVTVRARLAQTKKHLIGEEI
ncbi:GTP-binding protein [Leuconostoc citreum]